jgi:hypothetical protein
VRQQLRLREAPDEVDVPHVVRLASDR